MIQWVMLYPTVKNTAIHYLANLQIICLLLNQKLYLTKTGCMRRIRIHQVQGCSWCEGKPTLVRDTTLLLTASLIRQLNVTPIKLKSPKYTGCIYIRESKMKLHFYHNDCTKSINECLSCWLMSPHSNIYRSIELTKKDILTTHPNQDFPLAAILSKHIGYKK